MALAPRSLSAAFIARLLSLKSPIFKYSFRKYLRTRPEIRSSRPPIEAALEATMEAAITDRTFKRQKSLVVASKKTAMPLALMADQRDRQGEKNGNQGRFYREIEEK